ncbi:MAG: tRNA pseudouridine(38-40) synthase TruA [Candidatus Thorarchaeota archaeon]
MTSYLARLFYLGDHYHGSQYQPSLTTVQGELIKALSKWSGESHSTQTAQLSGRTDKGVHSIGQLVMITTDFPFNIDKINRYLPDDIILWAYAESPPTFIPRYDVLMRHYRYYLDESWTNLNINAVKQAISLLIGSKNFSQISKPDTGRNTTNTTTLLNISIHHYNHTVYLDIFGTRFLWKLVRKMVTLLTEIGHERIKSEQINDILQGRNVLPSGIQPAPPENLVLIETVIPIRMKRSKYAIRIIRNKLNDQLEKYRRSLRTVDNLIDYFFEPMKTSPPSTKQQNRSHSLD